MIRHEHRSRAYGERIDEEEKRTEMEKQKVDQRNCDGELKLKPRHRLQS